MKRTLKSAVVLLGLLLTRSMGQPLMDTTVTYQGQLKQAGVPITGKADIVFRLFDAEVDGTQIGSQIGFSFVDVVNGLFTVALDFGTGTFDGHDRWLEIQVEFPSGKGNWTTLRPRQRLTAVPYALHTRGIHVGSDGDVGIGTTNPLAPLHAWSSGSRTVRVRNASATGGTAIAAEATAGSGFTAALDAYVSSPSGSAVYAFNEAESGNAYAVQAEASSVDGVAIYGRASNSSERSTGIGVRGRSDGDYGGTGVFGEATNTGTAYGVRGVSAHDTGVRGDNSGTGNSGLLGTTDEGVYGRGRDGAAEVRGVSAGWGPAGHFVINDGRNTEPAVKAHTPNESGYAGYFTGGRNYFEGRVGIGTDTPASPLHIGTIGNWHWTIGDGRGDLVIGNLDHGLSIGVHPDYALTYIWTTGENERLRIGNPTDGVILAIENDSVGIGTISPAATLDVMGDTKLRGNADINGLVDADYLRLHGATADGWVMTSDSNGNASWQPALPGDSVWNVSGDDITYTNGNVGVGTTTPAYSLDVDGKVLMAEIDDGVGWVRTVGSNGNPNVQLTYLDGFPDHGYVSAKNASGYTLAGIYVDHNGQGVVTGDLKSFRVPHPNDPAVDIWYACIEGPEAAMYVRGTGHLVEGRATIALPEHFSALGVEESMTVQLTPKSFESKGLAVGRKSLAGIEVGELNGGRGSYDFHWEVKAVRSAHRDFAVTRPWTQAMAAGDQDVTRLWSERMRMIEDRARQMQLSAAPGQTKTGATAAERTRTSTPVGN